MDQQFIRGILLSGSMIIAIGGQNAFLLKQALKKNNIFAISTVCFLSDVLLLSLGILGVGSVIDQHRSLAIGVTVAGVVFLLFYGFLNFKSAFFAQGALTVSSSAMTNTTIQRAILATLAITFLNPHVYLDTIVILGGITGPLQEQQKIAFLLGSLLVSFTWFYGVGYGARILAPIFNNPRNWRVLEFVVGMIMWYISYELLVYLYHNFF